MTFRLVHEPIIIPIAETFLRRERLHDFRKFLDEYDPEVRASDDPRFFTNEPQGAVTDAELLAEIAGRSCYRSFGAKKSPKSNAEYLEHALTAGHLSIAYHAQMTFVFAGISRGMTHELIRHYVGHAREEEGAPSQESTRYAIHGGWFVVPPGEPDVDMFEADMRESYRRYLASVERLASRPEMTRKQALEVCSKRLPMAASTSLVWTSNPVALAKMIRERTAEGADAEFQRFAKTLRGLCLQEWPNLFRPLLKGEVEQCSESR